MNSSERYRGEGSRYISDNESWHAEDSAWKAGKIFRILQQNQLNPSTVADVGCGAGEILSQLYNKLPETTVFTGFDISEDAHRLSSERAKNRLTYKCQEFGSAEEYYDLILLIDVFEHVEDYMGFLKKIKPKGKNFIFHIPLDLSVQTVMRNKLTDFRNKFGHLHYFSRTTAMETLKDCGYVIKDWFYTAGSLELPPLSFKARLAVTPRKIVYYLNKNIASCIFGGFSLMVLAESKSDME